MLGEEGEGGGKFGRERQGRGCVCGFGGGNWQGRGWEVGRFDGGCGLGRERGSFVDSFGPERAGYISNGFEENRVLRRPEEEILKREFGKVVLEGFGGESRVMV